MPYWSFEEEKILREMLEEEKPIEKISERFHRSREAVVLKAKRLGLDVEKCLAKSTENKLTKNITTTTSASTSKLKPVKFEDLPSPNEAMGLLWAAIRRLQDPDVSKEEAKKLRLMLSGVKSYIHLDADYVLRIREAERHMLTMFKTTLTQFEHLERAEEDPPEKARLQAHIEDLKREIAEMEKLGVKEEKNKTLVGPSP